MQNVPIILLRADIMGIIGQATSSSDQGRISAIERGRQADGPEPSDPVRRASASVKMGP